LRQRVDLREHLARGRTGDVGPRHRCGAGRQHRHTGRRTRELDAGHVGGDGHVQTGRAERVGELTTEGAVNRGEHDRCAVLEQIRTARRAPEDRHGPGVAALGGKRRGERAERGHQALGQHQQARPPSDPFAVGGEHRRQRPGRHCKAHEIIGGQLELGCAHDVDRVGQVDTWEVALVLSPRGYRCRLFGGPAAEIDVVPRPGEGDGETRAPGPSADDRRPADRRKAAEPFPLEHHAWPDPVGHGLGQLRRGVLDFRKTQGRAGAEADLAGADAPAVAYVLGADHSDRDHRRA
jgi:hypothetical protein